MIAGVVAGQTHIEARDRLETAGWRWLARGDWAQVYLSPDGRQAARVVSFDPAYALHVRTCLANPQVRYFQRIDWHCPLAPAGQLVVMERLEPPTPSLAAELCCVLAETKCLERSPCDAELLAWADLRQRDPELRDLFALLRATAAEGARSLGWFGGLDIRPGNLMRDESGQLKLIDPYFIAGPKLIPAMIESIEAVARHYSPAELRGFLEIAVFEEERDNPGPVLQRLRERVASLRPEQEGQ
jgi:hypothetical protein